MIRALQLALALLVAAIVAQPASAQSTCKDLKKTTCESRKTCTWVKGYVRKDKVKVDSYCRSAASNGKKKKSASSGSSACSGASAATCRRRSACQWVSGYKKSDGSRVRGSCRVKRTAGGKKDKPTKKDTKSKSACNTTNFITCRRLDQCRWVSGYTRSDGTKVKGTCRAKS